MKIFQINTTVNAGSTGRIAENIGSHVIQKGGESIIGYGRASSRSNSETYKIGGKLDQLYHLIQTRLFDTHGFHSINSTKELLTQIEVFNPDIIQLHNLHGYYLNIELLFNYLKGSGKPIVWTLHDCWAFTGHCCHFKRVDCEKWKTQCYNCPLLFLYPQSIGFDNSRNNYVRKRDSFQGLKNLIIVSVSEWLESQVKQSFLQEYPVQTIFNGIDLSIFKPNNQEEAKNKLGFPAYKIILGVANEWSDGKGLGIFVELAKSLDEDYRIVLIGLNEKQIKDLPENIIGYQKTQNLEELVDYYNAADVFVSPSIAETFGLVVAEAMACGTPCIVSNSSALPELVTQDVGEIVDGFEAEKFIDSIRKVINEGKERYRENCRKRAERFFGLQTQMDNYFNLYSSLLD